MARTVEFNQMLPALYEAFSAYAAEEWAAANGGEPFYGPGVRPSVESFPDGRSGTGYIHP